ncbi:hypothetical protein AB833_22630 [Chromatiales bacterium (ex Bugula neritina AB1)]|nr:hypothetical protein AB833_22630 [Chromatiales bacterium (ex Bugula neritina AB1)]
MLNKTKFAGSLFFVASMSSCWPLVNAQTGQVIAECRDDSFDNEGFAECIKQRVEESANLLANIEKSWVDEITGSVGGNQPAGVDLQIEGVSVIVDRLELAPGDVSDNQVTQAREVEAEDGVIAIVGSVVDESLAVAPVTNNPVTPETALEQFHRMQQLYQQYRDERCQWESVLTDTDRVSINRQACHVSFNMRRVRELRKQLAERRVSNQSGNSFRGYYLRTADGSSFQACDRREEWRVTGNDQTLDIINRRYESLALDSLEMVYVELRGRVVTHADREAGSDLANTLVINSVSLMRPILERDCVAVKTSVVTATGETVINDAGLEFNSTNIARDPGRIVVPTEETGADLRIDDLAEAGYLYGYFSDWMSACSIEENRVCEARSDSEGLSPGEWKLVVDRSYDRVWRVRLQSAVDVISDADVVVMHIDGKEILSYRTDNPEQLIENGITLARGSRALRMIEHLREGYQASFSWNSAGLTTIQFSLSGITRALRYFDESNK